MKFSSMKRKRLQDLLKKNTFKLISINNLKNTEKDCDFQFIVKTNEISQNPNAIINETLKISLLL